MAIPLYVDLDGTLTSTDLLWESLVLLVKKNPLFLFALPFWLMKGRAHLKQQIASHVEINPSLLPYHEEVLAFLKTERSKGKSLRLATASNEKLAQSVARHLGIFDSVMASSASINLKGVRKLSAIQLETKGDFGYIGDSTADVVIWKNAREKFVVAPSSATTKSLAPGVSFTQVIEVPRPSPALSLFRALRVHQWVKNILIFIPVIAAHQMSNALVVGQAITAFFAFCSCASGVYLLNDLFDLASDRQHRSKKNRPFAAGHLPLWVGLLGAPLCMLVGIALSLCLPQALTGTLVLYIAITSFYSFSLKRYALVDVLCLAALYTMRIIAGHFATGIPLSPWLLAFSSFFFLSLAFLKRYSELLILREKGGMETKGRGYRLEDIQQIASLGSSSGTIAVLVLALYIHSNEVRVLYHEPRALWLACPLLLYWISRMWLLTGRGEMNDDPVVFAILDKTSYVVGVLTGVVVTWASLT